MKKYFLLLMVIAIVLTSCGSGVTTTEETGKTDSLIIVKDTIGKSPDSSFVK